MNNPSQPCNVQRMLDGTPAIAKSCAHCGLGPCAQYTRQQAEEAHRGWSIGVSSEGPQVAPLACPMPDVPPARIECGTSHGFAGYTCTRNKGHLGPCALHPVAEGEYAETRDEIGQLINDALAGIETQVDAVEITLIAESIIAKLRPELIPVAKPEEKKTVMDGALVHAFLEALAESSRMQERNTWTSTYKHSDRVRREAFDNAIAARRAMLDSEKEIE